MFRNDVYEPIHKLNPGRTFYTCDGLRRRLAVLACVHSPLNDGQVLLAVVNAEAAEADSVYFDENTQQKLSVQTLPYDIPENSKS